MARKTLLAAGLCVAALLTGCATARTPQTSIPPSANGPFVAAAGGVETSSQARADWWRLYNDPVLDGLVTEALANNKDIAVARANLAQVRASLSEARANLWPTTGVSASASRGRASAAAQGLPNTLPDTDTYSGAFDVSYEFDIFGRKAAGVRAADADTAAAREGLETVRVTVAAETARAYSEVCGAQAQLKVAERTLDLQRQTAGITKRQLDAGRGTGLDVASADSAVQTTLATLPQFRAARDSALFRLAVLTGKPPAEASQAAAACYVIPVLSQPIPTGDGQALLARRPDVRQAERQVAAAAARVKVATASLYPSISLGGNIGTSALNGGDLGSDRALSFSVGPLIKWSFPNIGVARAQIRSAEAGGDLALATFDGVVLNALQETETALSAYANELDRNRALRSARASAAEADRLSKLRFDAGLDSFLNRLINQRTLATADAQLAASDLSVAQAQVALFKALAGPWNES